MKAFFLDEPGSTHIGEIDPPMIAAGEVLLRVELVGFCGSDLNSFRGRNPLVSFPRIPGHEVAATIEAVGPLVPDHLAPGAQVTVVPYTACGQCASCRRGRSNACRNNQTLGVQRDGALREYIAMPWEKIVPARGLTLRKLCLVEPLSVGFHAINRGRVSPDDVVAIFGCGGVGLGAIAASAFRNARTIAVDVDDSKLGLAVKAGATDTIHSAREPLHERLQELTGGQGPDVIVEAIGLPLTFRGAVEEVAYTGRVVYIGYSKEPVTYETRFFVQKELDILGSRNATPGDFEAVISMLEQGRFPVEETISMTTPMEEAGDVLRKWDSNPSSISKVLVQVTGR
jgi:threonine dehydrogenase-like Zn-dependent dehydrogenase